MCVVDQLYVASGLASSFTHNDKQAISVFSVFFFWLKGVFFFFFHWIFSPHTHRFAEKVMRARHIFLFLFFVFLFFVFFFFLLPFSSARRAFFLFFWLCSREEWFFSGRMVVSVFGLVQFFAVETVSAGIFFFFFFSLEKVV